MSVQAMGKIRNYQLIVSSFIFLNLPLAYFLLKAGFEPYCVLMGRSIINFAILVWRVFYLKNKIGLNSIQYFKRVLFVVLLTSSISAILPLLVAQNYGGWIGFILSGVTSVFSVASFL